MKKYTNGDLLAVIKAYYILTKRGGDYPAVALDDIQKSAAHILKSNGITNITYYINGGVKNEIL